MFEDSEYTEPVKGKKEGTKAKIDKAVGEGTIDDFDGLLLPGGYSPDKLRVDDNAVQFSADLVRSNKPVFAICHAGQLLVTAQVLQGRKFTCHKSIIQNIKNAGAEFIGSEVVVDGNIVSSRHPSDLPAFTRESLKKL
jgi:protease I